jgi:DNA-binding transcriptional ArsR family regulator
VTGSPPTWVLGPTATALRRRLGPTVWVVLEVAVTLAHDAEGDLVVHASVRSLASEVGLAKNTVARALSVLRGCGLVTFTQTRADDGAFSAGRYAIVLPADVFTIAAPTKTIPLPARPTNRVTRSSVEQLALLPN